ncbi:MAG TPA: copper-translocating P-type ATPase, partial [Nitrososphaeraceae archaeon]|nr:copper-translocating P-type ATPase [Nitrososphaeraceae archaeon]
VSTGISCNCCDGFMADIPFSSTPSSRAIRTKLRDKSDRVTEYAPEDHKYDDDYDDDYNTSIQRRLFSNTKLLIAIGIAATVPIILLELLLPDSLIGVFIMLALASSVQILLGGPFYARLFRTLRNKSKLTTDTLVVLSTSVAYSYSIVNILIGSNLQFFEASSSVLTIFTIGEYLETRILRTTSKSLRNLLALKPKYARVTRNGKQQEISSDEVIVGDIVITRPGEKIATDGTVIAGESSVDESIITGESIPVEKKIGSNVIGGTINKNGYIEFKATKVGNDTVIANIIEIVRRAKMSKAPIQRIADRAVQYFIPIVLSIAIFASLYWIIIAQEPISFAVTVFATILVVSCPCALGIATPMVISLGIDRAARQGVLVKGGVYLEKLSSVDIVIFDKTGTLTYGKPEVTDIITNIDSGYDEYRVLQIASSVEIKSEHPIARAIVELADERSISPLEVRLFSSISGNGVLASYQQARIFVGSPHNLLTVRPDDSNNNNNIEWRQRIPEKMQRRIKDLEAEGKTVIAVFVDDKIIGLIAVADTLRTNAGDVIKEIKRSGKDILLLSGDNNTTTQAIARKVGIDKFMARVLPEHKRQVISKLQAEGKVVMMVGDGINDAPALAVADIGVTMGSGTDVAVSSGNVILMKGDLKHLLYTIRLGSYSLKKIKQNLGISFAYNVITISIAAGLFYGLTNSLILTPGLAALGWVISDTAVFGNSLLVRKFRLITNRGNDKGR